MTSEERREKARLRSEHWHCAHGIIAKTQGSMPVARGVSPNWSAQTCVCATVTSKPFAAIG
jgi:hypothetical protein